MTLLQTSGITLDKKLYEIKIWLDGAKDRKGGRKLRKTVIPLNASVLPFKMFRYFCNKLL